MAKRSRRPKTGAASETSPAAPSVPRLGTVIRFTPGAAGSGIKRLESSGLRVASSRDFKSAAAVPNNFDGAEVQYFEKLGLAVVRRGGEKLQALLQKGRDGGAVRNSRPERRYRSLGFRSPARGMGSLAGMARNSAPMDAGYLRGYRDGVNELIDRLLGARDGAAMAALAQFDETRMTWGLQATNVSGSCLSGKGIKVCVLDTGFDHAHPDFSGRAITKKLFASQSSQDDMHGHGTHCIGTACGSRNPQGVPRYGVAYEAEIFAGKVLGDDGFGTDRSILAGIDWALEQKCEIISMSLGAATSIGDAPNDDYEQVGQVCLDAGTLIVAAAGNESERPGMIAPVGSPANASTIMAVAAIDRDMQVARFSCGGLNPGQNVDIAAPGVDILSSIPGGIHDRFNGTSMATPHVAGVAALLAQSDATLRGQALWDRLIATCRALSLPPRDVGAGFLQAPSN
jgi:subtilisin family serine protease